MDQDVSDAMFPLSVAESAQCDQEYARPHARSREQNARKVCKIRKIRIDTGDVLILCGPAVHFDDLLWYVNPPSPLQNRSGGASVFP